MSNADEWMPLLVADYLADTTHMSTSQHGAYLLLTMAYFHDGPLPDDDKILAKISRCYEPGDWDKVKREALGMFEKTPVGFVSRHVERWNYLAFGRLSQAEWRALKTTVLERDGPGCAYCEADASDCDHVIPLSRGGTNDLDNLVMACGPCNGSKGAKLLTEWRQ